MLKNIVLISCLIPTAGFANEHVIEFKSEQRGDIFKRHFAELRYNIKMHITDPITIWNQYD